MNREVFLAVVLGGGVLALGAACVGPYVPAVSKDRMARLSVTTARVGTTTKLAYSHSSQLGVYDFRSSCFAPRYQGSIKLPEGTTPITSLPAKELILLEAHWTESRFVGGSAWCDAGLLFVPEHGKSYVFAFTGPSDPASTSRRLTCRAGLFEHINGPSDPRNLAVVPSVVWPGQFGNREEVCAVTRQAIQAAATPPQDRVRLIDEPGAARASGEAAARASRLASPAAGSLPKAR